MCPDRPRLTTRTPCRGTGYVECILCVARQVRGITHLDEVVQQIDVLWRRVERHGAAGYVDSPKGSGVVRTASSKTSIVWPSRMHSRTAWTADWKAWI